MPKAALFGFAALFTTAQPLVDEKCQVLPSSVNYCCQWKTFCSATVPLDHTEKQKTDEHDFMDAIICGDFSIVIVQNMPSQASN